MKNFQNYSRNMLHDMEKLEGNYKYYAYPGKKVLAEGKRLLQSVLQINTPLEFFAYISKQQDDFLDLSEDYEPVKTFFGGEQQQIFMRTLDMLEIYEDSKAYITDKELESIVSQMQAIIKKEQPYRDIPKLPELRDQFMDAYGKVLDEASKPVMNSIDQAKERVVEVVDTKEYAAQKRTGYIQLFVEIENDATKCNNVSRLRAYADKADALKIRLLNEMDQMDADIARKKAEEERKKREEEQRKTGGTGNDVVTPEPEPVVHVKTTKNVTIKNVTGTASWRLESADDVDNYLAQLRKTLLAELDKTDIVNVEF